MTVRRAGIAAGTWWSFRSFATPEVTARVVVIRGDLPQPFQEVRVRRDVRPLDRFHDYACETIRVFPNPRLSLVQIVEGQHDRIFQDRVGRPARSRDRYQASLHLLV